MRVVLHEGAVLEAPGLALVGVADDGLRVARGLGHGLPFHPGGEAGPAAPGELRSVTSVTMSPGEVAHGALQRQVAAGFAVALEAWRAPARGCWRNSTRRSRRGSGRAAVRGGGAAPSAAADPDLVADDDGHHVVAAAGAGHRGGALGAQRLEDLVAAVEAADVPGADPRRGFARGVGRKVVVEVTVP